MMEDFISFALIFLDVYCCALLYQSFAAQRREKSKLSTFAAMILLDGIICAASLIFDGYFYIKEAAVIAAISIVMFFLFQIRYLKALILSMFFYGVMMMAEYVTVVIFGTLFSLFTGKTWDLTDDIIFYIVYAISKILICGIILCIKKMFGKKAADVLTGREWRALFAVSFITIFSIGAIVAEIDLTDYTNQPISFFYIIVGLLAVNFIVYFLINNIIEREIKLREHAVFREKVKSETAMYRSLSENLEKQRKRTHEYKNQIAAISALAAGEQYQELKAYIEKIDSALQLSMDAVDTNNVIVNAVLNAKYWDAVRKGIVFVLKVNDLSMLKMEEEDLVVILSNLLNNAVEACGQCKDKVIKLKFVMEKDQVIISVKNSMETEPIAESGALLTTKAIEKEEHGMGIRNVIETVEKYGGRYVIDFGQGSFQFSILIPND